MTNNTQLPDEVLEEINIKAHNHSEKGMSSDKFSYIIGATEYASKLHTARTLLSKFISRHEAGLLPDRFIYDEIKKFLDGK